MLMIGLGLRRAFRAWLVIRYVCLALPFPLPPLDFWDTEIADMGDLCRIIQSTGRGGHWETAA